MNDKDDNEKLADILYTEYCLAVGGKAFNGDSLPSWIEFKHDPLKIKQYNAWIAVADKAIQVF